MMKTPSINELKKEMNELDRRKLTEIISRLARFKQENKELISYLLFYSENEHSYIIQVKELITDQFKELNSSNIYLSKKTVRKVLRTVNKHVRFSGLKSTEVELRIYYLQELKSTGIDLSSHIVLINLYSNQLNKIRKLISTLDEDVQMDYQTDVDKLLTGL